jgi:peptidyl-prolyl cis-trans isomerase D
MQVFRSSVKVIGVVFAVLMLVFMLTSVDWGALAGGGSGPTAVVGRIHGQKVDYRTFETAVQQQIQQAQQTSAAPLGLEQTKELRDQVWDQMVTQAVLNSEYKRRGITASDEEADQMIRSSPPAWLAQNAEFQTEGKFDLSKYQRWLLSSSAQPYLPLLEAQAKDEILQSKLLRVVTADVYLSDAALWQWYRDRNDSVTVGLTAIIPRNAVPDSTVPVSQEEVAAYYKAHPDDFKRPNTAFMSFVTLPRFTNAADTAAALERARAVRAEIDSGAPFAEVAKRESSDSVSAARGGDLGTWARGSMVPEFDSAAAKLPLNTLSEPVLSPFGYHLIEITKRTADSLTGRHILIPIELAGDHRDQLDARTDTLERLAASQLDSAALDTAARALKLTIGHTGPVQEGSRVQLGRYVIPDAGVWAFKAKRGETSPIIETDQGDFVFRLDSLAPEGVPPLSSIRPAVEVAVRREKQWKMARKVADDYLKKIEAGADMADAAKSMHLAHNQFGPFTRTSPPLPNAILVGAAFGLPVGQHSGVLDTEDGYYVIKVLSRTPADSAAFNKELDQLRVKALQLARQDRVRSYLAALKDQAKVVDNRSRIYRTDAQTVQQPQT